MSAYKEAGVDEFIVPGFNMPDPTKRKETLDRLMQEVVPAVR
jgi:hypothetical protein